MATAKMIIFVFSFTALFTLLFALVPSNFFVASFDSSVGSANEAGTELRFSNVTVYENAEAFTLEYGDGNSVFLSYGLPEGHSIEFWWNQDVYPYSYDFFEVRHTWPGIFGGNSSEKLQLIEPYLTQADQSYKHIGLLKDELCVNLWENEVEDASYAEWELNGVSANTLVSPFNNTLTMSENWDAHKLNVTVSYEIDWNQTGINALTILAQLLTFQSPAIGLTGVGGTIINAFIAIPIWIGIAILLLVIIQSVIPFIRGFEP